MSFDTESYPFNLGLNNPEYSLSILSFSTLNAEENLWLQRGLVLCYAFNHEEAIYCFNKVLDLNSSSPMAHYGIALSHGPNYNTKFMTRDSFPSAEAAYSHTQVANELIMNPMIRSGLFPVEVALVEALRCRFNPVREDDASQIEQNTAAYIDALHAVYEQFGDVPCVASLYAEALMQTNPWELWDLNTGTPTPYAARARVVLEKALVVAPNHPGLNHFYVHLMEMSPTPEVAMASCDVLRFKCSPDAGHLVHMPSHIYVLLGMYHEAAEANIEAIAKDDIFVAKEGISNYYTGYRIHNMHFVAYAAMFAGRFAASMDAAATIKRNLPPELLSNAVFAMYFESFYSIDLHVLVRFGKWDEILSSPLPVDIELYPYTIAVHHYSKGIAHAILGNVAEAEKEQLLFRVSCKNVPSDRVLHNNFCLDILEVADAMLEGEIMYRKGHHETAFATLELAVSRSDALVYDEPWGWMQPPVHALGALLLEQGYVDRAEAAFRKDMDKSIIGRCHPDNIWALRGLASCLTTRLGECCPHAAGGPVAAELAEIQDKIAAVSTLCDTEIGVACMCATGKIL